MDKYDEAVAYFKKNPDRILVGWSCGKYDDDCVNFVQNRRPHVLQAVNYGRILFGSLARDSTNNRFGCATQAKCGYQVEDNDLLDILDKYPQIPNNYMNINVDNIEYFAHLRRDIDAYYATH